jgi:lipopolysaccharide/colanic/teichoic acid biosynthesis glycosyltransferase
VKRLFDIILSILGLILLSPLFIILAIWIKRDSKGPVFYKQIRIGKDAREFNLYKFRSMRQGADKQGLLTVGGKDPRITKSGSFIRRYKLDEFPQLINVLNGEMSIVGPRPEVPKYVALYTPDQQKVLSVKPGISDWASIYFRNENELLAEAENPEEFYISEVMPQKLLMNLKYIDNNSLFIDVKIILNTIKMVLFKKSDKC